MGYIKHIEETHKVEDGYKCDQCLKVKSTRSTWMHHCVVYHRNKSETKIIKPDNEQNINEDTLGSNQTKFRHLCTNCKLQFKNPNEYRKHIEETHQVEDGYKCNQCLKVKSTRLKWMHHCVVYHREKEPVIDDFKAPKPKPFCDICNKEFEKRSHLYYHTAKFHEDPVTCEVCGKVTNQHDMKMHRKKAHHMYDIPDKKRVKKM